MKLLILSFYYSPDLSAGSFRTAALVKSLLEQLPENSQIELITTLPNRYSTYSNDAPECEVHSRLKIHRIPLPVHQSGMVDQSKAFLSYARGVNNLVKNKNYDLVYATSSRLMTAALGAFVARRGRMPLYLDIRDIFVDTIKDVLPNPVAWAVKPIFSLVEKWAVESAAKINLVSEGFLPYFKNRYPKKSYCLFTNGIDEEFILAQPVERQSANNKMLNVVYAGNMGEGQGLHEIIPHLAKKFEGRLHFRLIGDGGRRKQLVQAIDSVGCSNVELLSPVKRDELVKVYRAADILFLHLNDYDAFRKVLPSKIFEYAALGKPIWAGIAGYAAKFVNLNINNSGVFPPCDVEAAASVFATLDVVTEPRTAFSERFARSHIMREMASDVISLVGDP